MDANNIGYITWSNDLGEGKQRIAIERIGDSTYSLILLIID